MKDLVALENLPNVLEDLEKAFFDIPFENSDFQTKVFVLAAQQTPGRAYRAIGLRMLSKIQAVREYIYNQKKTEIDLEEKQYVIDDPKASSFDKRRAELEIARIREGESFSKKLLNDAMHDLNMMWAEFKKFPKYTREMFEAEEEGHFRMRLERQMHAPGPMESVQNMDVDRASIEQAVRDVNQRLSHQGNQFSLP